jgi:hypothetical protein
MAYPSQPPLVWLAVCSDDAAGTTGNMGPLYVHGGMPRRPFLCSNDLNAPESLIANYADQSLAFEALDHGRRG